MKFIQINNMRVSNFKVDFIGVGAPKAGTTWVAECLREHPQICFSKIKEINFFNKENFFYIRNRIIEKEWNYEKGIPWYAGHFSHCHYGTVKGEFSTYYLYDKETPELIKKHFPEVKIIIILRNPVELFNSHYNHAASQWKIAPIEELISDQNGFIKYGFYSRYINRYLKNFSCEKVLILLYDDIKKDPASFIRKIHLFLNIDENFIPASLKKIVNATAPKSSFEVKLFFSFRNKMIKYFGSWLIKHTLILKRIMKIDSFFRNMVLKKVSTRKKEYKKMSEELRKKLINIYLPEIEKLEKLLLIDLSDWKK